MRPSVVSSTSSIFTERVLRSCSAHKGPVTTVLVGRNIGAHMVVEPGFWITLFTGSVDGTIKQWHFDLNKSEISDGAVVRTIYGSPCSITCIARFPSLGNKYLVSGCSDGSVILWTSERELAGSKVSSVLLYPPYENAGCIIKGSREGTSWVTGLAVSDGEIPAIISGDSSGWVKTFQLNSDMKGADPWKTSKVCEASIRKLLVVSSTDCSSVEAEDLVLVLCSSYKVTGLDLTTLERLFTFDIPHHDPSSVRITAMHSASTPHKELSCVMAWSGPKSRLVLGASLEGVSIYDTAKGCEIDCDIEGDLSLGLVVEAAFSPCGCSLFTLHASRADISVYSVVATQRYARFGKESVSKTSSIDNPPSVIYLSTVHLTLALKQTSFLMVGDSNGDVKLWDMEESFDEDAAVNFNCRGDHHSHLVEVTVMIYLPWCHCVACGMEDGTVSLMPVKPSVNSRCQYLTRGDISTGGKAHRNTVTSFCIIKQEILVCGSYDGSISLWRISPSTTLSAALNVKFEGSINMFVVHEQELLDDAIIGDNREHLEEVLSLATSDDDGQLFAGGSSGSIMQFNYSDYVEAVPGRIEHCPNESILNLKYQPNAGKVDVLYAITSRMKVLVLTQEVGEWNKRYTLDIVTGIDNVIGYRIATVATVLVARKGSDVLVVTGDDEGMVNLIRLDVMEDTSCTARNDRVAMRKTFAVDSAVSSIAFSDDQAVIFVGTTEGEVVLLPFST